MQYPPEGPRRLVIPSIRPWLTTLASLAALSATFGCQLVADIRSRDLAFEPMGDGSADEPLNPGDGPSRGRDAGDSPDVSEAGAPDAGGGGEPELTDDDAGDGGPANQAQDRADLTRKIHEGGVPVVSKAIVECDPCAGEVGCDRNCDRGAAPHGFAL